MSFSKDWIDDRFMNTVSPISKFIVTFRDTNGDTDKKNVTFFGLNANRLNEVEKAEELDFFMKDEAGYTLSKPELLIFEKNEIKDRKVYQYFTDFYPDGDVFDIMVFDKNSEAVDIFFIHQGSTTKREFNFKDLLKENYVKEQIKKEIYNHIGYYKNIHRYHIFIDKV